MKVIEYKKNIDNLKKLIVLKNKKDEKVMLNLGAGSQPVEGCINIDLIDHTITDFVLDLMEMELSESCVDEIQTHHVFEHFTELDGKILLKKWYSWLKDGGKIVISVPNLKECIDLYCRGEYDFESLIDQIYRGRCRNNKDVDASAQWRKLNRHRAGYSPETLKELLTQSGFKNIKRIKPPLDRDPKFTITFEAIK